MTRKLLITTLLLCFLAIKGFAQELTVTYEGKYNADSPNTFAEMGLSEEMRSSMVNAYKDVVFTFALSYNNGESTFRVVPSQKPQSIVFMGQTIDLTPSIKEMAKNYTYKNHAEKLILDKTSFFQKEYIVKSKMDSVPYKTVNDKHKEILGYDCLYAISPDGKTKVWYTPNIPIMNEPLVTGLKGLVLEYDNGQQIFTATKIEDKCTDKPIRPVEGKEMSKDAFDKMVKERVDMMKRGNQGM